MPSSAMTTNTRRGQRSAAGRDEDGVVNERFVTTNAVLLEKARVALRYLNRLMEVLQGERSGVIPTVDGLGDILSEPIVRRVTVVTDGHVMVSRLFPGGEDIVHHVTVHAGLRIVREVREALGVAEGEEPEPEQQPREDGDDEGRESWAERHETKAKVRSEARHSPWSPPSIEAA